MSIRNAVRTRWGGPGFGSVQVRHRHFRHSRTRGPGADDRARWRVKIVRRTPGGLRDPGSGTALLRSGRVTLREASFISLRLHDASLVDLNAVDLFRVAQVNPEGLASGFIVADERPAMTAAFRIARKKATITRPGGVEFPMASDILSRFANDVELHAFITATAAWSV